MKLCKYLKFDQPHHMLGCQDNRLDRLNVANFFFFLVGGSQWRV